MAGLASFVDGFVGGTNTRHAWDDRKRQLALDEEDRKWLNENRDWARSDRAYTVQQRERLLAEQQRQDKLAADERAAAEAAWEAGKASGGQTGRSVMGGTDSGASGTPLSFGPGVGSPSDGIDPGLGQGIDPNGVAGIAVQATAGAAAGNAARAQGGIVPAPANAPRSVMPPQPLTEPTVTDLPRADGGGRLRDYGIGPGGMPGAPSTRTVMPPPQQAAQPAPPAGPAFVGAPQQPAAPQPALQPAPAGQPQTQAAAAAAAATPTVAPPRGQSARTTISFGNPMPVEPAKRVQSVDAMVGYVNNGVPKMIDFYMKNGMLDKAQALQTWAQDQKTQASMRLWAEGLHDYAVGDEAGMLDAFSAYYNSLGTGQTVDRAGSKLTRDKSGNITGIDVAFVGKDGKTSVQHFEGADDLLQEGIYALSPLQVFQTFSAQAAAGAEARAEGQKLQADIIQTQIRAGAAGSHSDPARIASAQRLLAQTNLNWANLTPEEQIALINQQLDIEDQALAARQGGGTSAPPPPVLYAPGQ